MAYNTDFKQGALDYIKEGHRHIEATKVLMLASELSSRGKRKTRTRTLRAEKASRQKRKITLEELKAFVEAHPDTFFGKLWHILIVLFLQYGQL